MDFATLDDEEKKEYVRESRKELGMSQKQFAEKLGYSQTAVSFWEAPTWADNSTVPRLRALGAIYDLKQAHT